MPQKKEDYITNKVLIVFSVCLLGILALIGLTRTIDVGTTYALGMTILRASMAVCVLCIIGGVILCALERRNQIDNTYRIMTGRSLITVAAVALVILAAINYYGTPIVKIFYVALPALAVYYLVYHSYQREFFIIAADCGAAAFLLLLARWIGGVWVWIALALAIVLCAAQLLLTVSVRGKNGHLKLAGRRFAFNFTKNAYVMLLVTPVIMALLAVGGILIGPTASTYALFAVGGYAFVTAVYYTVKLM